MKFGQLVECDIRNIFLEKSYTKCGVETSPRPLSENKNRAYLDQLGKVPDSLFLLYAKLRAIKIY